MIIIHRMMPVPRLLLPALSSALAAHPVVVLTGARQTGKSTLAQRPEPLGDRLYLTLDDWDVLEQATTDPASLLTRAPRVTVDEVQRAPSLLLAIKRVVDRRRVRGQFLVTGSANLLLMQRVSESLAGRATHLTLWPMTRREQLGLGRGGLWPELLAAKDRDWLDLTTSERAIPGDWRALARHGGYPTPALELDDAAQRATWFAGYVRTYLERDVANVSSVSNLPDLRRLMRAACLRLGQLLNQAELGRDVALPQPTVHRWLNLLEMSYQLVRVPAFAVNRTKRLIKTPKLYWADTGLAHHIAQNDTLTGAHLENLVLSDLLAWRDSHLRAADVMYWRTAAGEEVDFVIEAGDQVIPIEVKATKRPTSKDARHLVSFRREYPRSRAALLLHDGDVVEWIASGVLSVPWWRIL
jgi:predicted AAA+ superfamily ATPase